MSQRETVVKPLSLTAISGVNERTQATELPPQEYSNVNGTFPEFAGLQSRIWGKRLLDKYANSILGIHQFWTPLGYGVGLYQFTGTLDAGYWLTPTSVFNLDPLPLGIDGGGMTLDDFGQGYGSNFGYGDANACTISFLGSGTDHSSCIPAPSGEGTPDDNNGGPAGQGKKCKWQSVFTDHDLSEVEVSETAGSNTYDNSVQTLDVGSPPTFPFGCVAYPSTPTALGPDCTVVTYNTITPTGTLGANQSMQSDWDFFNTTPNPVCDGKVIQPVTGSASANKMVIDLSLLGNDIVITNATLIATISPGGSVEVMVPIILGPQTVDAWTFKPDGVPVLVDGGRGFSKVSSFSATQIRIYTRKKVCS